MTIKGSLAHISVGKTVWGVNKAYDIFMYQGKNRWKNIKGKLTNLDVSEKNHVWGVNTKAKGAIFRWTGKAWEAVKGAAIQIAVGDSGVWCVNAANNIYYRTGTFHDKNTKGKSVSRTVLFNGAISQVL